MSAEETDNDAPTKDELLSDLEKVAEKLGKEPSQSEYNEHGKYTHHSFYREIGGWNKAKKMLDMDTFKAPGVKGGISEEDILQDIIHVKTKIGRSPTKDDYNEHGAYYISTIEEKWGSFEEAKEELGLTTYPEVGSYIDTDDVLYDVLQITVSENMIPSEEKYEEIGGYPLERVYDIAAFDEWDDVLAEADLLQYVDE